MEPTITCGKHLAQHADISGSRFEDVNLAGASFQDVNLANADFNDINLSHARLHNVNLSDLTVSAVQIGGSKFCCVGPPPDEHSKQARQRPVSFDNSMLCDSTFHNCDLSGVRITNCNIEGMTIDGMSVTEMIEAYRQARVKRT